MHCPLIWLPCRLPLEELVLEGVGLNYLIFIGEPDGIRTHDPLIKSYLWGLGNLTHSCASTGGFFLIKLDAEAGHSCYLL